MMTLFESGCQAIEQGLTSLEEVVRVLGIPMATKRLWRWRGIDVQGAPVRGCYGKPSVWRSCSTSNSSELYRWLYAAVR